MVPSRVADRLRVDCAKARAVVFAMCGLLIASAAQASPVTWTISGTLTDGVAFRGVFTFEGSTPDENTSPLRGDYSNAGVRWRFRVGETEVTPIVSQGWSGNFEIFDDLETNEFEFLQGDHFRIYADAAPTTYLGRTVVGIDIFFEDASGRLISTDTLPSIPPDLSLVSFGENHDGWADYLGLTYAAEFRLIGVDGHPVAVGQVQRVTPDHRSQAQ
jgi:hypothetical protein